MKHTKGKWAWQNFGDATYLTAQHGLREIIIGSYNDIPSMSKDGRLQRIDPEHPNAKLISKAPEMHEVLIMAMSCIIKHGSPELVAKYESLLKEIES